MAASSKRLKSEVRFVADLGAVFILQEDDASRWDSFVEINIHFEESSGKFNWLSLLFVFLIAVIDAAEKYTESIHTQSECSWDQVQRWIKQCSADHANCQPRSTIVPRTEWPTRLISVGDASRSICGLVETSKIDDSTVVYMTLSHCWGNHVPLQLLSNNYTNFKEINVMRLPKTFQDAIAVTRKLRVPYLWIDSLCIIQDSISDWATESAKMHHVYRHSYLNLAAAASPDSTGGLFFKRSPLGIVPCELRIGKGANAKLVRTDYAPEKNLILFTRAWVFQEWLLAPRTVVFGKREIYWECAELHASEVRPEGFTDAERFRAKNLVALRELWPRLHEMSTIKCWEVWNDVIRAYSALNLARPSDKLAALAGLATEMSKSWNGGDYLAGIWSYNLRSGLLWSFLINPGQRLPHAPSWSWASVQGKVVSSEAPHFVDGLIKVLEASIKPSISSNPYGSAENGIIRMEGPILRARTITGRKRTHQTIALSDNWMEYQQLEDSSYKSVIEATIKWDDKALDKMAEVARVYLVPFEIFLCYTELRLQGLILLPTYLEDGQFRRVGFFEVEDKLRKDETGASAFACDSTSDPEISLDETESRESCPQINLDGSQQITRLELEARLVQLRSRANKFRERKPLWEHIRARKLEKWMSDPTKQTAQDYNTPLCQEDEYKNGKVNTTLLDRYGPDMKELYPNIYSLLATIFVKFEMEREEGKIREDICGKSHGNGYFTFDIV